METLDEDFVLLGDLFDFSDTDAAFAGLVSPTGEELKAIKEEPGCSYSFCDPMLFDLAPSSPTIKPTKETKKSAATKASPASKVPLSPTPSSSSVQAAKEPVVSANYIPTSPPPAPLSFSFAQLTGADHGEFPFPAKLGQAWLQLGGYGSDEDIDCDDDDKDELGDVGGDGTGSKKRRKRANRSEDIEKIAAATEENLRAMNIDPTSNEGMKQKRKIRNRMSAQLHRERKKAYITYLENVVRDREARILKLAGELDRIHTQFPATKCTEQNGSVSTTVESASSQLVIGHPILCGTMKGLVSESVSGSSVVDYTSASNSSPTTHSVSDAESMPQATDREDDEDDPIAKRMRRSLGPGLSLFSVVFLVMYSVLGLSNQASDGLFSVIPGVTQISNSVTMPFKVIDVPMSSVSSNSGRRLLATDENISIEEEGPLPASYRGQAITSRISLTDTSSMIPVASLTTGASSLPCDHLADSIVGTGSDLSKSLSLVVASPSFGRFQQPYVLSSRHALWKYQDATSVLFPRDSPIIRDLHSALWKHSDEPNYIRSAGPSDSIISSLRSPTVSSRSNSKRRRNLRSWNRDDGEANSIQLENVASIHSSIRWSNQPLSSEQLLLAQSHSANSQESARASSPGSLPLDPIQTIDVGSHVVMTHGRALLDAGLAGGLVVPHRRSPTANAAAPPMSTVSTSHVYPGAPSSDRTVSLSTWVAQQSPMTATPPTGLSTNLNGPVAVPIAMSLPGSSGRLSADAVNSQHLLGMGPISASALPGPKDANGDQANVLLMLMPLSSVRWGKSWGDSSTSSKEQIFKEFSDRSNQGNDTQSRTDSFSKSSEGSRRPTEGESGSESDADMSNMWVEIGCQVFRAQLVRNVTFS